MSNIKQFGEVKSKPDKGLIDLLADLLGLAQAGKLIAVAFVGETNAGHITHGHSIPRDRTNVWQMVGALDWKTNQIRDGFIETPDADQRIYTE